ncbi:GDSL-type esterase/lipase family protein [Laceyella putida]|uniref:GDSL-type esterase/lipase family protein n=1 Tax=Laceyella putida TaxID=110101 RepID=A0ABW2RIM0_9BACL
MRKSKKIFQFFLHTLAVFSFILLGAGFILSVNTLIHPAKNNVTSKLSEQTDASVAAKGTLIGLGDSLTRGIGDSNGQGYFGMVKRELQEKHGGLSAINLSISGQTSHDLVSQIKQSQTKQLVKQAQWIVITIGGNDLFRSSERLQKIDPGQIERARQRYEKNLQTILGEVKSTNPDATVFLFGLYNPFGDMNIQDTDHYVIKWNDTITQIAEQFTGVVVVPTFDLFQLAPRQYLYSDHFHPNEQGYRRMADRLLQVILDQSRERKTAYGK